MEVSKERRVIWYKERRGLGYNWVRASDKLGRMRAASISSQAPRPEQCNSGNRNDMKFSKADPLFALSGLLGCVCAVMEHIFAPEIVVETPPQGSQDVVRCSRSPHWTSKEACAWAPEHTRVQSHTHTHRVKSHTASHSDCSEYIIQKNNSAASRRNFLKVTALTS